MHMHVRQRERAVVVNEGPNLVKTSQRMLLVVAIKPVKKVREKIKYSLRAPTLSTRHRMHAARAAEISHDKQFETYKKSYQRVRRDHVSTSCKYGLKLLRSQLGECYTASHWWRFVSAEVHA